MVVWGSLSRRLLLLTVAFVMLAEVLIFVPSVARFRKEYLVERLEKAQIASMAALAAPDGMPEPALEQALLEDADVYAVALKRGQSRRLMMSRPIDDMVAAMFDLRDVGPLELIRDAFACMLSNRRFILVKGTADLIDGEHVEIVVDERALKQAMLDYGFLIFQLSLVISAITGGLVFLSVNAFLVRPMRRVVAGMAHFREDPEDASRIYEVGDASGEIGQAERELARAQTEVHAALRQKSRLAALGAAVARINHDLRNILASAQLLADRLESSQDPMVKRIGPKLIGSLDRAIRLCRQTLEFGRADEPAPKKTRVALSPLVDDVFAALGLEEGLAEDASTLRRQNLTPPDMIVSADPDQLFRALHNLARNAVQAMEAAGGQQVGGQGGGQGGQKAALKGTLTIEARSGAGRDEIDIVDTGPGLPEKALENLFKPFKGAVRKGGSGLGLAIAAELVRGHGGELTLVESDASGSRFRVALPRAPAPAQSRRRDAAIARSH